MKKIITIALSLLMLLTLGACGSKDNETSELSSFAQGLKDIADPAFNICTQADTTVIEQDGNFVFFLMYNKEDFSDLSDSYGDKLVDAFKANVNLANCEKIAEKIIEACADDIFLVGMNVEEGPLNGFSSDVKGFKDGYVFSPMIGTIPFVAYVFEV